MAAFAKSAMVLLSVMTLIEVSFAVVYTVGESQGWTTHVDYKSWAANKTFHVGDIINFQYNAKDNDVIEVSREDFHACNLRSPLAFFSTGRDMIKMSYPRHYYYVCTSPGHCLDGQKVDIRVLKIPKSTPPTPSPTPNPSTSPSPSPSATPNPSTSPSATPKPSPNPSPSATPRPSPSPSPSPIATPPSPSATPNPSTSPSPSTNTSSSPKSSAAPPHDHSIPPVAQTPAPSKKSAASSMVSSKGLLAIQLLMALCFLAYF
ncbi:uclacyanin 1 [Quercus suber]|uniref:Uclacyanin 1 n=1 Tax=Quercus suber TaxID=58331 RepID=A0AAW0LZF6_QUESU